MGERNEVRVSDADSEILAMKAISAALAPLDDATAARVLDWAAARYGPGVAVGWFREVADARKAYTDATTQWMKGLAEALEAMNHVASDLGVKPADLTRVIERVWREAAADETEPRCD